MRGLVTERGIKTAALGLVAVVLVVAQSWAADKGVQIQIASNHESVILGETIAFDVAVAVDPSVGAIVVTGYYPDPEHEVALTPAGESAYRYEAAADVEGARKLTVKAYAASGGKMLASESKVVHAVACTDDLVDNRIWLETLTDAPDPVSAVVAGSSTISSAYAVQVQGQQGGQGATQWVRQMLTIRDGAGSVVAQGEAVAAVDGDGPASQHIAMTASWDGAGVPDGTYTYSARGIYYWHKETPGQVIEHIIGVSATGSGQITLDNTAPDVTALLPEDSAVIRTRRPEISAVVTDAVSGVDPARTVLTLDSGAMAVTFDQATGVLSAQPAADLTPGWHELCLQVGDMAGNLRAIRSAFCLDYVPPTAIQVTVGGSPWAGAVVAILALDGTSTGVYGCTDEAGRVVLVVPEWDAQYQARVERNNVAFLSEPFVAGQDATVAVPADTTIRVTRDGAPLAGRRVYVTDVDGVQTGIGGRTDESGEVVVTVPASDTAYRAKAVHDGKAYFSGVFFAGATVTIAVPSDVRVLLTKGGQPVGAQTVYLDTLDGVYTGVSAVTDASGRVAMAPPSAGVQYVARVVWNRITFVSSAVAPGQEAVIAIPTDVIVRVTKGDVPLAGLYVYVLDMSGQSTGARGRTNAAGEAVITVPAPGTPYRATTTYGDKPYLSGVFVAGATVTITVPADTTIRVIRDGAPLAGRRVYVTDLDGVQTGIGGRTDESGELVVTVPESGTPYMAKAVHDGRAYVSGVFVAGATVTITVPADTTIRVTRDGAPLAGLRVYVTDVDGVQTGIGGRTDEAGELVLPALELGRSYRAKAVYGGRPYFSGVFVAGATVIIAVPSDVTVVVTKAGLPLAGQTVYLDTPDGVYTGVSALTDATGKAVMVPPSAGVQYVARVVYKRVAYLSSAVVAGQGAGIAIP